MPTPPPLDREDDLAALDRYYAVGLACMAFLVVSFVWYRATEPGRREAAREAMQAERIALGEEAYRLHCASCHGPQGRGGRGSPTLAARELLGQVSDEQLGWLIAGGVPGTTMAGYDIDRGGPFTRQDTEQVVAYLRSLEATASSVPDWRAGAPAPPPSEPTPGGADGADRADGADGADRADGTAPADAAAEPAAEAGRNYARHCAPCHGPRGEGTAVAGAVRLPPEALDHARLVEVIAEGIGGTAMQGFGPAAGGPLDADEVEALSRWLEAPSGRP